MEEVDEQIQDDVIAADQADSSENTHHKTRSEVWKFFEHKGNLTVEYMFVSFESRIPWRNKFDEGTPQSEASC